MTAKELIGEPTPTQFTNAELAERIQKLEQIICVLSERVKDFDNKDFYIQHTTSGTTLRADDVSDLSRESKEVRIQ